MYFLFSHLASVSFQHLWNCSNHLLFFFKNWDFSWHGRSFCNGLFSHVVVVWFAFEFSESWGLARLKTWWQYCWTLSTWIPKKKKIVIVMIQKYFKIRKTVDWKTTMNSSVVLCFSFKSDCMHIYYIRVLKRKKYPKKCSKLFFTNL